MTDDRSWQLLAVLAEFILTVLQQRGWKTYPTVLVAGKRSSGMAEGRYRRPGFSAIGSHMVVR